MMPMAAVDLTAAIYYGLLGSGTTVDVLSTLERSQLFLKINEVTS